MAKLVKLAKDPPSFVVLAFRNGLGYRNADKHVVPWAHESVTKRPTRDHFCLSTILDPAVQFYTKTSNVAYRVKYDLPVMMTAITACVQSMF